jgi:pimeloyl-ACP methyl ester carboxylesterase
MHPQTVQQPPQPELVLELCGARLRADLHVPHHATGVIVFAHGSGSSRLSPRNRYVAKELQSARLGTLLFDLLTPEEENADQLTRQLRFDIDLLSRRMVEAVDWLQRQRVAHGLPFGAFGASTGAAAALAAAAERPEAVCAVVSRGGRPDLAPPAVLARVRAPTLLVVGEDDTSVLRLNEEALRRVGTASKRLVTVPGASHLFDEPGTLEVVAQHAAEWFSVNLV